MWTRLYGQSQKVWQYKTKRVGEINTFMGFICCWSGHIIRGNMSMYCFDLRDHTFITVLTHTHGSLIWTISTCLCLLGAESYSFIQCGLFSLLSSLFQTCHLLPLNVQQRDWTHSPHYGREIYHSCSKNVHVFVRFYSGMLCTWSKRC